MLPKILHIGLDQQLVHHPCLLVSKGAEHGL
jgi:hypothetical protein